MGYNDIYRIAALIVKSIKGKVFTTNYSSIFYKQ